MMSWSDNLEPGSPAYEIAASENTRIRVVAGPGAGKSFAMKRRVARLLELGVEAKYILPVTFTRIAAEDLHRELVGMGVPGCEDIQGTTLHALALRILMRQHVLQATGRTPRPINEFESRPLLVDLHEFGGLVDVRKQCKAYEAAWARLQRDEPGFVQSADDDRFEHALLSWLRFHKATMIGEVIPILHRYLRSNPAADERREFAHILVDEYQDLNRAEQAVVDLLADDADICIVGDDDQSIYSFKHAHPEGIREWLVTNIGASDLTLTQCRRCPTRVVNMANNLIARNTTRPVPRSLLPRAENGTGDVRILQFATLAAEVVGVANLAKALVDGGTPAGQILILAQRKIIGTPVYETLVARGLPARSYYADAELDHEDAQRRFALLKLLVDRDDRVALRWLLGYGSNSWMKGGYFRLRAHCESQGADPWPTLEGLAAGQIVLPHTGALITKFRQVRAEIDSLDALGDLFDIVDSLFPGGTPSVRDIRALAIETLTLNPDLNRAELLSALVGLIAKPEVPTEIEDIRVMSLHKSKGLSASVTIICGCVEGLLPMQPESSLPAPVQQAQLEEQRRLFYVGITRVKADPAAGRPGTLILTYSAHMAIADVLGAGMRPAGTRFGVAQLHASRFIAEMGAAAPRPILG